MTTVTTRVETSFEPSRIEIKGIMKNRLQKLGYDLIIPALVTLLAISCSASAVWGS